jgi:hypothetical protein
VGARTAPPGRNITHGLATRGHLVALGLAGRRADVLSR